MDCAKIKNTTLHKLHEKDYRISEFDPNNLVVTGLVPTNDLNLRDKSGKDAWNNPIEYSVTLNLTDIGSYTQTGGIIQVLDHNNLKQNWKQGNAQYVLLSSGFYGCETKGLDEQNCQDHTEFIIAPLSLAQSENHYDDILIFEDYIKLPNDLADKICNLKEFFNSFNISEKDFSTSLSESFLPNDKTLRICNTDILLKMDMPTQYCRVFVCSNGLLLDAELLIE